MSKGLGTLQTAIVRQLSSSGTWRWASDVAYSIFCERYRAAHDSEPGYGDNPSRALIVAVKRAASGLVRRGLVVAGMPERSDEGGCRVAWWLPEHQPPRLLQRRIPSALIDNAVLAVLSGITEEQAEESFQCSKRAIRETDIHRHRGDVSYELVCKEVIKMLGADAWRARVSIHRAVYRLQSQGRIRLKWYAARRIGSVRLE